MDPAFFLDIPCKYDVDFDIYRVSIDVPCTMTVKIIGRLSVTK
jgi:hypothetical protein